MRNALADLVLRHRADRIRHAALARLVDIGADRVRNAFGAGHGDLSADRVGHFLSTDLRDHSCAADCLLNGTRNPSLAADRLRRSRAADDFAAAGITRIRYTLLNARSGNLFGVRFPSSAADINNFRFRHRFHHRVAAVPVTGLRLRAVRRVATIAIAGFVARFADVVAHISIARLVARLANVVANVAIARLVAGLTHVAGHCPVAGFINRLADLTLHAAIVGFVARFADRVALISVTRLIHVAHTGNRNCFRASVHHDPHRLALFLFPDHFTHGPIPDSSAAFCVREISARIAVRCRHAGVSSEAEQSGICHSAAKQHHDCCSGSHHEPIHRCPPLLQVFHTDARTTPLVRALAAKRG